MSTEPKKKRKTQRNEMSAGARLERYVPVATRLDKPMREFEQHLVENPDNLFMSVLQMQPEDSKFHQFLTLLADPAAAHMTLSWKARKCGVTVRELLDMLTQANNLAGMLRIGNHVPKIMEQQAEAALAADVPCYSCYGEKTKIVQKDGEPAEVTCDTCQGAGSLRTLGNDKAIDRTLQMAGVLGKDGGMNINVNTQINNGSVAPVENVVSDIGKIIDVRPE